MEMIFVITYYCWRNALFIYCLATMIWCGCEIQSCLACRRDVALKSTALTTTVLTLTAAVLTLVCSVRSRIVEGFEYEFVLRVLVPCFL